MTALLTISLLINVLVLGLVVPAILRNTAGMMAAYGPPTPARGIVVAFYLAILLISVAGLIFIALGLPQARDIGLMLLPVQVVYKGLTALTIGVAHPVAVANVTIALFHIVTLITLYH